MTEGDQTRDGYGLRHGHLPEDHDPFGTKINLKNGIWNGAAYEDRLRLINVPVLKDHGGAQVTGPSSTPTASSRWSSRPSARHRTTTWTSKTTGTIWSAIRRADLHVLDAIHVVKSGGRLRDSSEARHGDAARLRRPGGARRRRLEIRSLPCHRRRRHHPDNAGVEELPRAGRDDDPGLRLRGEQQESASWWRTACGALDMMSKKHREGGASAIDVQRLVEYYYEGAWI